MLKLRVILATYNHEKFIAQALDSVLTQQVNFPYDVVVVEDCSTDSTREILSRYQKKYPTQIHLVLSPDNKNDNRAFFKEVDEAPAEYIAVLDGDDFWTSPLKLQKQVDYLDAHPECSICFHNVRAFYEDKSQEPYNFNPPEQAAISELEDILPVNFIGGCSAIYRKSACTNFPDWIYPIRWADWAMNVCAVQKGKIGYINEILGAYRIHSHGMYSGMEWKDQLLCFVQFYEAVKANLPPKYEKFVTSPLSKHYYFLALEYEARKDPQQSRFWLRKSLTESSFNRLVPFPDRLRLWLRICYKK